MAPVYMDVAGLLPLIASVVVIDADPRVDCAGAVILPVLLPFHVIPYTPVFINGGEGVLIVQLKPLVENSMGLDTALTPPNIQTLPFQATLFTDVTALLTLISFIAVQLIPS
jgi:hypothetical protein